MTPEPITVAQPSALDLVRAKREQPSTPAALAEQLRRAQIERRAVEREAHRRAVAAGLSPAPVLVDRTRRARPAGPASPGHGKSRRTNGPKR